MENETTPKLLDINGLTQYDEYIKENFSSFGYRITDLVDTKENVFRYYEMPEASEELENQIVEYIGDTDQDYTQGYFYKCVGDYTQLEPVFSWEQVNVQPAGGSSGGGGILGDTTQGYSPYNAPVFNIYTAETGEYVPAYFPFYVKIPQYKDTTTYMSLAIYDTIKLFKKYNDAVADEVIGFTIVYNQYSSSPYQVISLIKKDYSGTDGMNWSTFYSANSGRPIVPYTFADSEITGTWNFTNLPYSDGTPSYSGNLTNKKYVDKTIPISLGISAYSTSSTYAVGDYVYYGDAATIYKCNTAITTAEAWTAAHWTQKTATDYLNDTLIGNALNASY